MFHLFSFSVSILVRKSCCKLNFIILLNCCKYILILCSAKLKHILLFYTHVTVISMWLLSFTACLNKTNIINLLITYSSFIPKIHFNSRGRQNTHFLCRCFISYNSKCNFSPHASFNKLQWRFIQGPVSIPSQYAYKIYIWNHYSL